MISLPQLMQWKNDADSMSRSQALKVLVAIGVELELQVTDLKNVCFASDTIEKTASERTSSENEIVKRTILLLALVSDLAADLKSLE